MRLVRLGEVQAISARDIPTCSQPSGRGFRRVRVGRGGFRYGPTTVSVPRGYRPGCDGDMLLVAPAPDACPPRPKTDPNSVATVAEGVAEGLREAPLLVTRPAPWVAPDFRGKRDPHTATVVLNTFGNTDVRTIQAQNALASYLTTTNRPIATVNVAASGQAQVLSFQAQDDWTGDELTVCCQDQEILYLSQWSASVNGKLVCGPVALLGGKAKLNIQAKYGETVSIDVTLAAADAFAVGLVVGIDGWLHPSLLSVDGTYPKVLRSSPSWPKGDDE